MFVSGFILLLINSNVLENVVQYHPIILVVISTTSSTINILLLVLVPVSSEHDGDACERNASASREQHASMHMIAAVVNNKYRMHCIHTVTSWMRT